MLLFVIIATTPETPTLNVRLVGGSTDDEGRVEIMYDGQWGTVCDDSWGLEDAGVVCRMLGFDGASEAPGRARFGQGLDSIWLDDVMCSGEETHLVECPHPAFGTHNCAHSEDAGAVCSYAGNIYHPLRLCYLSLCLILRRNVLNVLTKLKQNLKLKGIVEFCCPTAYAANVVVHKHYKSLYLWIFQPSLTRF